MIDTNETDILDGTQQDFIEEAEVSEWFRAAGIFIEFLEKKFA